MEKVSVQCWMGSHPLRVRELKQTNLRYWLERVYRTPCGCVNWNCFRKNQRPGHRIAPLAGAWIETLWEKRKNSSGNRTPCGCVNWNKIMGFNTNLSLSHPLRVRELKQWGIKIWMLNLIAPLAGAWIETNGITHAAGCTHRTPCGCVNWNRYVSQK